MNRLLTISVLVYGLTVNGILLARWLIGENTTIALILPSLTILLLSGLIVLPVGLLTKRPRLALWVAPAALIFAVVYGPRLVPRGVKVEADTLRLATYNLRAHTTGLDGLVAVIQQLDSDVVALQEVSREAAQRLAVDLREAYPHQLIAVRDSPYYGTGLISRLPLLNDQIYPFEPNRLRLQRAQIEWRGRTITLFNFHAQPVAESWQPPDINVRRDQIIYLLAEAGQIREPHILIGDFNFNEFSEDYARVTANYIDVFATVGVGLGLTGPHWGNLEHAPFGVTINALLPAYQRFDYAFHDPQLRSVKAAVWLDYGGSDHKPLVIEVAAA